MKNKDHTARDYTRIAHTAYNQMPELLMLGDNEAKAKIRTYILKSINKHENQLVDHQLRWLNTAVNTVTSVIRKHYKLGWRYVSGHIIQQL